MSLSTGARLGHAVALALLLLASLPGALAGAEQSGRAGVEASFNARISPRYIPRFDPVPISLDLSGTIRSSTASPPPQLGRIEIAFGASGGFETAGLPVCPQARLRNATQRQALAGCRDALVGHGAVTVELPLNPRNPLLAHARLLAFNGISRGRPAVWAHAFSTYPPVSFVLPFHLRSLRGGAYGVLLRSPVRRALGPWPRLRSFHIALGRRYRVAGERRSYLDARCPLPPRFTIGILPVARATYHFAPRPKLITTAQRGCRVRR